MNKYYLLIFALFLCFLAQGQNTVTYKFIDEYRLNYKGKKNKCTELLFGKSFSYQRIYTKDSIFKEKPGLLYDGKPYRFKIQNGCWFIKKTGEWQLFYSPDTIVTPKIRIYFLDGENWDCYFKAVRTGTLSGHHCIIYEIEPITKVIRRNKKRMITRDRSIGDTPRYWFCPKLGIIKIETGSETNYIREDILGSVPRSSEVVK